MFHLNYPHRLITNALVPISDITKRTRHFDYMSKTTGILVFYINCNELKSPYPVRVKRNELLLKTHPVYTGINYFYILCNKGEELSFHIPDEPFYKGVTILQYPLKEHYELIGDDITNINFYLDYKNEIQVVSKIFKINNNNKEYTLISPIDGLLLIQLVDYNINNYKYTNTIIVQDNHLYHSYLVSGLNVTSCFCSKQDKIEYGVHQDISKTPRFTFIPFSNM